MNLAGLTVYSLQLTVGRGVNRVGAGLVYLAALAFGAAQAEGEQLDSGIYSTPPGITLVEIMRKGFFASSGYLWSRLGDAEGRTLLTSDNDTVMGESHCIKECAELFPPVIALPGATEAGDWTLVERANGDKQWAYQGKPLYRFAKESHLNEIVDSMLEGDKADGLRFDDPPPPIRESPLLPEGWRLARYQPEASLHMPLGVSLRDIPIAGSMGFVDVNGMTLYAFRGKLADVAAVCDRACERQWLPFTGAALSSPVGEFTFVKRDDGSRQWAYGGQPLFTYRGDRVPGDSNGVNHGGDVRWRIAERERHFMPPGVTIRKDGVHDKVLSTPEGLPLYMRNRYGRFRERMVHPGRHLYVRGKQLGGGGCDVECLKVWRPLVAPASAHSQGYWEVLQRDDGTRQWVYKGFALYTNRHDKPYGTATGHLTFDYAVGDSGRYKVTDAVASLPDKLGPGAFFWAVATP